MWFVFTVFKSSSVKNKPWLFKNLQRQSLLIRKYWDWWWIRIALFHAAFDNSCQDRKFQPRAALKLMVLLSLSTTFSTSYSPPENAQLSGRNQSPVMEIDLHAPSRSFATSSKWKCFFNTKKCPRFTNFAIALRAKRACILAWKKCQKWSIQHFFENL